MSVAKPASAGAGVTAIANTSGAYINVRTGPGTEYTDIGDLRRNTLVVYYPATRTANNWYWIEYRGLRGWVAGSVVNFEPTVGGSRPVDIVTPYDGKVAVWHWKGSGLPFDTIEDMVADLKRRAPNVKQIWVKTSDGSNWQGDFDSSSMAVSGPAAVDRWVRVLEQNGLEFHAWCVPKGVDIQAEADVIAAVCKRPGVRSMILDVEPYQGFWQVGRDPIRPFMLRLRQQIPGDFHLGMSMDPRPWHYKSIFPEEWFPFIGSIHPQSYWYTFRRTPEETLKQTYDTWSSYGRPVIPALQGDASVDDQTEAHTLATQRYGATGLSWWRYGVISQWTAINQPIEIQTSPAEPVDEPSDHYTDERIVVPGGEGFRSGTYTGKAEFRSFKGTWNWDVYYKGTQVSTSKVWAEWKTDLPESGRYEIATFVPQRHATTQRARFKIHGIKGTSTEVVVDIDQTRSKNQWVPLGIFDLVKNAPNAGKVFLNDVTGEVDKEIAFDAVRFRRIVTVPPDSGTLNGGDPNQPTQPRPSNPAPGGVIVVDGIFVSDGFDPPVGTDAQRRDMSVWPSGWRDASPFAELYFVGTPSQAYHTGADLNWGRGPFDDLGVPVYSPASGVVIYQANLVPWGNVTIIRHDPLRTKNGLVVYSRYGHMQDLLVSTGDRVTRGQQIGGIGSGGGRFVPHLHYDISPSTRLETNPGDWPGMDLGRLLLHYVDPLIFTRNNRP